MRRPAGGARRTLVGTWAVDPRKGADTRRRVDGACLVSRGSAGESAILLHGGWENGQDNRGRGGLIPSDGELVVGDRLGGLNVPGNGPAMADTPGGKRPRRPPGCEGRAGPRGRIGPGLGLLVLIHLFVRAPSYAQVVDPNMWGADPDGTVLAVARSGNTIYMGGSFTHVAPLTGAGVPFDAATGQPLPDYPKVAGYVYCVIPDQRGGWFIGGRFGGVGGLPRRNLAHILGNGSVASWAPDPDGEVYALALWGTKLYVGGAFTEIAGTSRSNLAAVSAVTGTATTWNPGTDYVVKAILVRDRSVYIGGQFYHAAGRQRYRLAELDAVTGRATDWRPDPDDEVLTLAIVGDTLFAGGSFRNVAGAPRDYLAAISRTTGMLLPWNAAVSRVPQYLYDGGPRVHSLIVHQGTLYVAGLFNRIGGAVRQGLAALSVATAKTTAWDPHAVRDFVSAGFISMALEGTSLFVGGSFDSLGGSPGELAGAVDTRTGRSLPWRPDPNQLVWAIATQGGTLYAGGWFTSLGPRVHRRGLAAFDARTGAVTKWNPSPDGMIEALGVRDGQVYVGGAFSTIGGQARANVAAVDSASGLASDWNPSCNGAVWSLAVTDSTVYVGGWFENAGGQPRRNLAGLDRVSGMATAWNPDPNDIVTTIAPQGAVVYVGGLFSSIGNAPRLYVAAVDADSGGATPWASDASDYVRCLAVNDTAIYVCGYFNYIGGQARDGIAAVSTLSGVPTAWIANASREVKQVVVSDGVVYAAGAFSTIGGKPRDFIAALDPVTGEVLDWNPGADGVVWALGAGGGRIYAGGAFQRMGTVPCGLIASISPASASSPPSGCRPGGIVAWLSATNPATTHAVIRFTLREAASTDLDVFDLAGRRVARPLNHEPQAAGPHELEVSTREWPAGCYFLRLAAGGGAHMRKILVVH